MATADDVIWGLCQENLQYSRHHENQRQAVTGFGLAAASALISFIVADKDVGLSDAPVAFMIVVIGIFGALLSAKEYERFFFHYQRFRQLRHELDQRLKIDLDRIHKTADDETKKTFPWLFPRSLSRFWLWIHLTVAAIGIALLIAALLCGLLGGCATPTGYTYF